MSQVRSRIVEEATRLFAEHGFAATSVRQIVDAAGVTKPSLYYHFGNKDGLFAALVELHLQAWRDRISSATSSPGSVSERLAAYVRTSINGAMEDPAALQFLSRAMHRAQEECRAVDTQRVLIEEAQLLTRLIAEGVEGGELRALEPGTVALGLMGMTHWHIAASLHGGPPLAPETADRILEIFTKGVLP